MRIVTIEEKKDEKFLREKTSPFSFEKFDKKAIAELISEMRKSMKEAEGVGLSANQIGYNFRAFVAQAPSEKGTPKFYAIFNPEIEKFSADKIGQEEGCLSVPGVYGLVERPERVTLTGFDRNGRKLKIKAWGFLARVFQHEVDHLNGKLFIDRAKHLHRFDKNEEEASQKI